MKLIRKSRHRGRGPFAAAGFVAGLVVVPAVALAALGNFAQAPTSPEAAGPAPLSVTAAKLNGDAFTDLVVTDFDESYSKVDILLGSASGNFTEPASSPEAVGTDSNSNAAAAADFDGDGDTDLAVANLADSNLSILFNNGSGNFTDVGTELTGMSPISVVAAHLDGSPGIDLAVANGGFDNNVTVMGNNGFGHFDFISGPAAGADPRSIVAGKFDSDADNDLAIANREDGDVTILLNNGDGNFTEPGSSDEAVGDLPNGLATGNFGGDATTDLAVANRDSDNVTILLGSATGDFTPAGTSPEAVGDAPRSLVAAQLGGSSHTDLAVANSGSDNVSILFGSGGGNFTPAATSPEAVGDEPFSIAAGAFGGGPGVDLATANPEGGDVTILLNDPPRCGGRRATILGTNGPDRLRGTVRRDVIAGLGGKDTIKGRGGNDILCGGKGRDRLIGGAGRDRLFGQQGRDRCIGGPKRDVARRCEVKRSI